MPLIASTKITSGKERMRDRIADKDCMHSPNPTEATAKRVAENRETVTVNTTQHAAEKGGTPRSSASPSWDRFDCPRVGWSADIQRNYLTSHHGHCR